MTIYSGDLIVKRNVFLLLTALFALLTFSMSAFAQDDMVVISLTVPSVLEDWVDEQIISDFEAQNPGIDVHIVPIDGFDVPIGGATIEEYLDSVEEYVSSADVVLMDSTALNSEITRTGYLLDLYPLVNSDMALDNADFYSAVWQSFQWDGGMWTFPVAWDDCQTAE